MSTITATYGFSGAGLFNRSGSSSRAPAAAPTSAPAVSTPTYSTTDTSGSSIAPSVGGDYGDVSSFTSFGAADSQPPPVAAPQPTPTTNTENQASTQGDQVDAPVAENQPKAAGEAAPAIPSAKDDAKAKEAQPKLAGEKSSEDSAAARTQGRVVNGKELSESQVRQLTKLQNRDTEVRAHEAAHISAGGDAIRSGATYEYQSGPDGKQYAIGGEVQIDLSEVPNDPLATILKMERVRSAALAPADPSSADASVAAEAAKIIAKAQAELAERKRAAFDAGFKKNGSEAEAAQEIKVGFPKTPQENTQAVISSLLPQFPGLNKKESPLQQVIDNAKPNRFPNAFTAPSVVGQHIDVEA